MLRAAKTRSPSLPSDRHQFASRQPGARQAYIAGPIDSGFAIGEQCRTATPSVMPSPVPIMRMLVRRRRCSRHACRGGPQTGFATGRRQQRRTAWSCARRTACAHIRIVLLSSAPTNSSQPLGTVEVRGGREISLAGCAGCRPISACGVGLPLSMYKAAAVVREHDADVMAAAEQVWFHGSQSTSTGGPASVRQSSGKVCSSICWLAAPACAGWWARPWAGLVEPEVNRNLAIVSGPTRGGRGVDLRGGAGGQQVGEQPAVAPRRRRFGDHQRQVRRHGRGDRTRVARTAGREHHARW